MKQRCAILSCDYFSGGDCANLCSLKPRQLQAPIRQVCGEVEQRPAPPEGDFLDLSWCWPAVAVLAVLVCVLLGSAVAVFLAGLR